MPAFPFDRKFARVVYIGEWVWRYVLYQQVIIWLCVIRIQGSYSAITLCEPVDECLSLGGSLVGC